MSVFSLPQLIGSLSVLSIGLFVYLKNPKSPVNFTYGLVCLSLFGWLFGYAIVYSTAVPILCSFGPKLACAFSTFTAPTFYHLVINYLKREREKKLVYFTYLITFVFFILCLSTNYLTSFPIKYSWGYYSRAGTFHFLYLMVFFSIHFRGLYLLWRSYLKQKKIFPVEATRTVYFFTAYLVALLGSVDFIQKYGIDIYPVGWLFELGFAVITAYAITRYHLMDIEVIIKKTAVYSILTALLTTIFISLILISQWFFSGLTGYNSIFATILGVFILSLIFQPLRDKIQALVDKLFFKSKYDYSQELSKISAQITRNLSLENILHTLQKAFSEVMKVSHSQVYLPKDFEQPEVKDFLSLKEATMREENLILPCITEGRLVAMIVLGKKMSEDPYREEDLRLLRNLADQTAVALDHARIYEENLKAEKQLLLADKLSSLGRVAAGLAHEIKNPLTAIKGMTQALERNPGDQETIKDFNAIIPKEVDRLTRLVENLSNLGKAPKFQLTKVDINTLLDNNLKLFESRCRKQGINLVKEFGPVPEIETDGERLTQVFTNLILNAIQAMPDGGMLTIQTKQQTNITIEISDTGHGIPEDKIKDIFEPFFTTKEEGTGLGLAITHKIIKDLGGEISVESKVGEGTIFRITLPCP